MKKVLLFVLGLFISLTTFNGLNMVLAQGSTVAGINKSCLTGMSQGCFSFDTIVHGEGSEIANTNKNRTVTTVAQDVIFAATYMVGTVLTIIIIISGLGYIFASRSESAKADKRKTGLVNAAIGAVLVRGAYAIVRLIQYIAKG